MKRIEEAQEIKDKPKTTEEQDIIEEFGHKAAKTGISDENLETYSSAIISEASHIEKEKMMNTVKTAQDSDNLKRS